MRDTVTRREEGGREGGREGAAGSFPCANQSFDTDLCTVDIFIKMCVPIYLMLCFILWAL